MGRKVGWVEVRKEALQRIEREACCSSGLMLVRKLAIHISWSNAGSGGRGAEKIHGMRQRQDRWSWVNPKSAGMPPLVCR